MRLLLIRHGQPMTGQGAPEIDPPLTDLGQAQAKATAPFVAALKPDVIYSSGMARAHQTAQPTAALMVRNIEIDERFSEVDYGGLPYVDGHMIRARGSEAWARFLRDPVGEMGAEEEPMRTRVLAAFHALFERHAEQTVAVFCHSIPINMITSAILGAPQGPGLLRYLPAYGSVSRFVGTAPDQMILQSFAEAAHLAHLKPKKDIQDG